MGEKTPLRWFSTVEYKVFPPETIFSKHEHSTDIYKTVFTFKLLKTLHTGTDILPHSNAHSNGCLQTKRASIQNGFNS